MIKVENIETWGFEHAIRGMRNPLNSWGKSDSDFDLKAPDGTPCVGEADLGLMRKLYKAGTEHRKYARQIFVSMDITAPLYWWKNFDTYKVGTVANSTSTMHTIHKKPFETDDFSNEHLVDDEEPIRRKKDCALAEFPWWRISLLSTIDSLNYARELYLETQDKKYWWQMIQLLPSSYNQRRTVTMNYENVFSIIKQRSGHKLDEWNDFIEVLKTLPYVKEIME